MQTAHLSLANTEELNQIATWLESPRLFADAFMLPAAPDPPWVHESILLVPSPGGMEMASVHYWAICEAAGDLVGCAIDYPTSRSNASLREVLIATPGAARYSPSRAIAVLTQLMHRLFNDFSTPELRARLPLGRRCNRLERLATSVGAAFEKLSEDRHPLSGAPILRAYYRCTSESFYASARGRHILALGSD